ncbi:MAG: hypothetical protein O9296_14245 [Novosphingobium sp.]|jgi:hypothetical protein|nr:hypothetical protein [Novosphingobium sp.]
MIVKALDTVHVSSVSSNNITTGQTFEVDDQAGRSLIERGLAIEVDTLEPAAPAETAATDDEPVTRKSGSAHRTKAE